MDTAKKITAYQFAIESVLLDDDYTISEKKLTLEVLFGELQKLKNQLSAEQFVEEQWSDMQIKRGESDEFTE